MEVVRIVVPPAPVVVAERTVPAGSGESSWSRRQYPPIPGAAAAVLNIHLGDALVITVDADTADALADALVDVLAGIDGPALA